MGPINLVFAHSTNRIRQVRQINRGVVFQWWLGSSSSRGKRWCYCRALAISPGNCKATRPELTSTVISVVPVAVRPLLKVAWDPMQ
jgi:hypothetical protein